MPRIQVGIRVRPMPEDSSSQSIVVHASSSSVEITAQGLKYDFNFDTIFDGTTTQKEIFERCAYPIVKSAIEGYNGCIFAYGQTGSGKTYTMTGPQGTESMSSSERRGMLARTIEQVFHVMKDAGDTISLRVSAMEIYNESITDLLRDTSVTEQSTLTSSFASGAGSAHGANGGTRLTIVETSSGIVVPSLFLMPISTEIDANNVFFEALSNRVIAEHSLNRQSSRSHVIYTFYFTSTRPVAIRSPKKGSKSIKMQGDDVDVVHSKLHLVDLAGSERVAKTGSVGSIQKEANHINRSLSFLEHVVLALTQSKRDHVPYRSSKLTHLLKDTLGGNCNTLLVACIWPHSEHTWETLSTLRFAARMKCIENSPVRNSLIPKDSGANAAAVKTIEMLKKEILMRDIISLGPCSPTSMNDVAWLPDLTKQQRSRTVKEAVRYALIFPEELSDDSSDIFELRSLSQFRLFASVMKKALWIACDRNSDRVAATLQEVMHAHGLSKESSAIAGSIPLPPDVSVYDMATIREEGEDEDEHERDSNRHGEDRPFRFPEEPIENSAIESGGQVKNSALARDMTVSVKQTFDEFKLTQGSEFNIAYEAAKDVLKEAKERHKHIVTLVNDKKILIDAIQEKMFIVFAPEDSTEETTPLETVDAKTQLLQELKEEMENAKKEYRMIFSEMQLCKSQVKEMMELKQRSLNSLVSAFEEYAASPT